MHAVASASQQSEQNATERLHRAAEQAAHEASSTSQVRASAVRQRQLMGFARQLDSAHLSARTTQVEPSAAVHCALLLQGSVVQVLRGCGAATGCGGGGGEAAAGRTAG